MKSLFRMLSLGFALSGLALAGCDMVTTLTDDADSTTHDTDSKHDGGSSGEDGHGTEPTPDDTTAPVDDTPDTTPDDPGNDETPTDAGTAPRVAGAIVITEIASQPVGTARTTDKWFELTNTTAAALDLRDCVFSDDGPNGGESFTVTSSVVIEPEEYVVFCQEPAPMDETLAAFPGSPTIPDGVVDLAITPDYVYGAGYDLDPLIDEIILTCGGIEIDRVMWNSAGTGPDTSAAGETVQLDRCVAGDLATRNDDGGNWCEDPGVPCTGGYPGTAEGGPDGDPAGCEAGATFYSYPNSGTPGLPNVNCGGPRGDDPCP